MGLADELKGDFLQMVALIGVLVGFVVLFALFSISIWLVVGLLVVAAGGYMLYGALRKGSM